MAELKLNAEKREATGNQVGALRREGMIPAVVYGPGIDNYNLSIDRREIEKIYDEAGESTLIDLSVDGDESVKVIVQSIQRHPLKHQITHVDLRQVKMDEAITASIVLELVGEAPAVKTYGAMMVHNLDSVEVRCLPTALVSQIEVDLSGLEEIGQGITVGELNVPEGIEILTENDVSIVMTQAPRKAEEDVSAEEGKEHAEGEAATEGGDSTAESGTEDGEGKTE